MFGFDLSFFKTHRALSTMVVLSLFLLLLSLGLTVWNYGRLAQSIVLHFDAFHGVDMLGARASVWWIWVLGVAMCLVNFGIAYEYYHRERFLSYLFLGGNVVLSLFTLVVLGVIMSVN